MSQANCFEICSQELKQIRKSKITIAEALDKLESLSNALNRAFSLDQRVDRISNAVDQLTIIIQDSLSKSFFGAYIDKLSVDLDHKMDILFQESLLKLQDQLLAKVDSNYLTEILRNKVNQNQIDYVKELMQKQQNELDHFVLTEFTPFKEKIKAKLVENEEIGKKEGQYKHKTEKVINELMNQVDVIQNRVNDFTPYDESGDEENHEDLTVEGLLNKMKQQINTDPMQIQTVVPDQLNNIQNAPKRLRLKGVAKKLDKLKEQFISSLKEIASVKLDMEKLHNNDIDLYSKLNELQAQTGTIQNQIIKTNSFRKESKQFKQEVTDTFKDSTARIHKMIEDFKTSELDKIKRIKRLEISQEVLNKSIEKHKKTYTEKLNESIKMLKYLDSQAETQIQQTKELNNQLDIKSVAINIEIDEIKQEIYNIKIPFNNIMAHKQFEIETLNEDLKRNQDVFRGLVEEAMTGLDKTNSSIYITNSQNYIENKRIKREIIKLRTNTQTPCKGRPRTAASSQAKTAISREESILNNTLPDPISEQKKTPKSRRQVFNFASSLTRVTPRNISSRE